MRGKPVATIGKVFADSPVQIHSVGFVLVRRIDQTTGEFPVGDIASAPIHGAAANFG